MSEYQSLDNFKDTHKISDAKGREISFLFKEIYEEYSFNEFNDKIKLKKLLTTLINESKEVNPSLIPYSEITNIIFTNYYYPNIKDSSFTERFKSELEKFIIHNFKCEESHLTGTPQNTDDLYTNSNNNESVKLKIDSVSQNSILVVYKIIQHAELAISQKQSLYEDLKDEINNLNSNIIDATQKYDNMMSNFISILGIFAAIMMATFGAIQGFSAIFSNKNNYDLTTIIIISCFGLFSLLSVLFILLHSISKLIDKNYIYSGDSWFSKYPIYSHTLVAIALISTSALTHFFKLNPPNYFPMYLKNNMWSLFFLCIFLIILTYSTHRLISKFYGYYHINNYINNIIVQTKNKIGLNWILRIIILLSVGFLIIALLLLINNIFNFLSFF